MPQYSLYNKLLLLKSCAVLQLFVLMCCNLSAALPSNLPALTKTHGLYAKALRVIFAYGVGFLDVSSSVFLRLLLLRCIYLTICRMKERRSLLCNFNLLKLHNIGLYSI